MAATKALSERAEESRQVVAAAKRTERDRAVALTEAQGMVEVIERAWARGDESKTAADLLAAQAEVTRATNLHAAARTAVRQAERGLVNDDTTIVDVLAEAVSDLDLWRGYTVEAVAELPPMPTEEITRPLLYFAQTETPTLDLIDGRVSGMVEIVLRRPDWGARHWLDVEDLPEALGRRQIYSDTHGGIARRTVESNVEERAVLTVRGVWPHVPTIDRLNGEDRFGQILAGRAAAHCSQGRRGEVAAQRDGYGTGSTTRLRAAVQGTGEASPARVLSTDAKTGVRRASVDVSMRFASSTVGNGTLGPEVTRFLHGLVGTAEPGLGRIESVEVLPDTDAGPVGDRDLTIRARFEFKSQAPR